MGNKINKAIKQSQDKHDEEHRVWYVGTQEQEIIYIN